MISTDSQEEISIEIWDLVQWVILTVELFMTIAVCETNQYIQTEHIIRAVKPAECLFYSGSSELIHQLQLLYLVRSEYFIMLLLARAGSRQT